MLFRHPERPGRVVRLAYCLNLHPAKSLDELLSGLRHITLPLRQRLARGHEFGVGMYLPATLASELANGAVKLARLKSFLDEHGLDPFTYNAFPSVGFGQVGLKERVFEPTWAERERLDFTLDVAQVAAQLAHRGAGRHISISTHAGAHSSQMIDGHGSRSERIDEAFARAAGRLSLLEAVHGQRVILSLEAEPRSCANDGIELRRHLRALAERSPAARQHLGVCVDTCHMAVEFEEASFVAKLAEVGAGIGKLQFSSALALVEPTQDEHGREQLFALDEPCYLHQVTGRRADGLCLRVGDLFELMARWAGGDPWWRDTNEWRCHFHVPVDLERVGEHGLTTTRAFADEALRCALDGLAERAAPAELHVEIETYTWDVLPRELRGAGEFVDGLEREYRHVIEQLAAAGWVPD